MKKKSLGERKRWIVMNIGIDIDSTINKAHYFDIIHGRDFCQKNGCYSSEELDQISVQKMFHMSDTRYQEYMDQYFKWNVNFNVPELGAPENIRLLSHYHIISIVTARDDKFKGKYNGEMMKRDTMRWFDRYDIPVNQFYFGSKDKAKVCKENDIDILIDDDPKHIISCADVGIPVIIFSQSYNEYLIHHPNTIYARNWYEVRKILTSFSYLK